MSLPSEMMFNPPPPPVLLKNGTYFKNFKKSLPAFSLCYFGIFIDSFSLCLNIRQVPIQHERL